MRITKLCALFVRLTAPAPMVLGIQGRRDLAMKQKALARLDAPDTKLRRFSAPDSLMRFLQTL